MAQCCPRRQNKTQTPCHKNGLQHCNEKAEKAKKDVKRVKIKKKPQETWSYTIRKP